MIGTKWIYKTKYKLDVTIDKHKAILIAKGYAQLEAINYEETFAPIAKMETIRTIFTLATQNKWSIYQMDVKLAFFNGYVEEEIYVSQPQGFEVNEKEHKVCRLKKALYRLKQAPKTWYSRIDRYFQEKGFEKNPSDPNLYVKVIGPSILLFTLYVDDLIYTRNNTQLLQGFNVNMCSTFEMTNLGQLHYFLGI